MELGDYVRIAARRWKLIVGCGLVFVAAASILTLQQTPQYASTTRLFVSTSQAEGSDAYTGGLFSQQRVTSYADLVTGQEVIGRVVDSLDLNMDPTTLADKTSATVVPETVILEITVRDPSPLMAQRLSQSVADQFTDFVAELETPPGQSVPPIKATIVDSAPVPEEAVSPQPVRNVGLALVLGLLIGAGIAVLRETLDTSVKGPADLELVTDAPILGSINYDARAQKQPLVIDLDTHAPRVEAFRVLRTNLQFVDVDQRSKVFVVTSSVPEEGKTTTACNLAITLAQAGQRVCLVEGDLRRPKVADYLRLEPSVGLTTVLVGRIALSEAIQVFGDLHVLASGTIPPNPAELLQSKTMAEALATLRGHYDVIIVDAPPLLPVTDAALLSAQADGAVLIVRHGKTTRDQVRGSIDRLTAVGGRLVGLLLNRAPERRRQSAYGDYGYGYGYAPQPGRRRAEGEDEAAPPVAAGQTRVTSRR